MVLRKEIISPENHNSTLVAFQDTIERLESSSSQWLSGGFRVFLTWHSGFWSANRNEADPPAPELLIHSPGYEVVLYPIGLFLTIRTSLNTFVAAEIATETLTGNGEALTFVHTRWGSNRRSVTSFDNEVCSFDKEQFLQRNDARTPVYTAPEQLLKRSKNLPGTLWTKP